MKKYSLSILFLLTIIFYGCNDSNSPSPEFPGNDSNDIPVETKPVMLWVDASANFNRFLEKEAIVSYLTKAKNAGFTDIILDVRPTSGEVMYKGSRYADEIVTWKGVTRDNSWDYLAYFIEQCKALNLRIYAAMNTFTAGQNIMKRGPVYTDPTIAAMTTKLYIDIGLIDVKDDNRGAVFLNPCLPEAQEYVLNIAKEIVTKYEVDGLMYDRCRYDNETADFSEASKIAFTKYVKEKYDRDGLKFPDDIFTYDVAGNKVYGIYRQIWYEWRANVIRDFFYKSKEALKEIKSNVKFATYTGGWYSTYYQEGSNWASNTYDPSIDFPAWANSRYKNTGFAEALDYHLAGFYYSELYGTGWWTIAGGIANVKNINKGACPIIASLAPEKFSTDKEGLKAAIKYSMEKADGIMIFDLYHVEQYNFWDTIKEGIEEVK